MRTFFAHDFLQLVVQIVAALGKNVRPLVAQYAQILLLVTVEAFLQLGAGTYTADGHVVDGLADDWQRSRVVHRSHGHQNTSRVSLGTQHTAVWRKTLTKLLNFGF